ncbi:orf1 [Streptococcus phage 858]|uniref:Orf1 n=1 Tax=Streptococcus phage 858 TaxID=2914004 RepID=B0YL51_9CAUD|nr:orf1 [Streptococcus phage 858]ABT17989.1 orf1 [Streptococcus phage 858]
MFVSWVKTKKDRHNCRHFMKVNTTIISERLVQCYCRKLMRKQHSNVANASFENIHAGERLHTIALNRK